MTNQFQRVQTLLGNNEFLKINQAHVCIAGFGAVGSFTAEALARTGIGHIRIIDADIYEVTNINRQLGADTTTIDKPKVAVAQNRLYDINPQIDLECIQTFINEQNMAIVDQPFHDGIHTEFVIDAIDTLDAKISLLKYCVQKNIPILSSMGAARKIDPDKIRFADISKTDTCPLAREVRTRLKKIGITSGIGCVYSTEQVTSQSHINEHTPEKILSRPILGSLITVTGSFGLRLASECIKLILNDNIDNAMTLH